MNNKTGSYSIDNEVDISELASDLENLEITQVNEKSLELVAQLLSFLYQEDKKSAE